MAVTQLSVEGRAFSALILSQRVVLEEFERRLRTELDLSFPLFEALFVLNQSSQHRLRMVDIKRRMYVSNSNVTQLIDKLEGLGFVERLDSPTDRRLVLAAITERGRQTAEAGLEIFNATARSLAKLMARSELEKISSGLTKIIAGRLPNNG
jgi:DNA-binding MarR family transcriptional regulator